ncbi:trimethylamine methyltransferase [bacterium]|nr:trimethylamine methyltransferase [bacterium]
MSERISRRAEQREQRRNRAVRPHPIRPIENKLPPLNLLEEEGVARIHGASMRLLKERGTLIVDYPPALETFRRHGAKVVDNTVYIDEETLLHFIRQAPSTFTLLARNPANHLPIGGNMTIFAPVYGPPFVMDLDNGRRPATLADFENFVKLTYMAEELHCSGGTLVEPNDIPLPERHLDMLMAHIRYSDKAFMGSVTHRNNAIDTVRMCEILFGAEAMQQNPATIALINASSPMRYDDRMFGALEVYAEARQALIITPFIIAGAMSPTTIAATLAQQNAEALFGICYAQMINPGTPVVYGSFLANIDMKSGAPCFGTPEGALAIYGGAQMARHYSLPYRSGGNFTAANLPDAQAGYESAGTMWPTMQAGTNFVLHAAGWLEGGLIAGYEKFVLDLEICGMMAKMAPGIKIDEDEFAWDAYAEVEPGGHFLGSQHTMRHYQTAFYQHKIFTMDNFEKWAEEGSRDSYVRANARWKEMLANYIAPVLDEGKREELEAYVARRRHEIRRGK